MYHKILNLDKWYKLLHTSLWPNKHFHVRSFLCSYQADICNRPDWPGELMILGGRLGIAWISARQPSPVTRRRSFERHHVTSVRLTVAVSSSVSSRPPCKQRYCPPPLWTKWCLLLLKCLSWRKNLNHLWDSLSSRMFHRSLTICQTGYMEGANVTF